MEHFHIVTKAKEPELLEELVRAKETILQISRFSSNGMQWVEVRSKPVEQPPAAVEQSA